MNWKFIWRTLGSDSSLMWVSFSLSIIKFTKTPLLCLIYTPPKKTDPRLVWWSGSCELVCFLQWCDWNSTQSSVQLRAVVMWGLLLNFSHSLRHIICEFTAVEIQMLFDTYRRTSADRYALDVLNDDGSLTLCSFVNSKCCHGNISSH